MADIIKTWPAKTDARTAAEIFSATTPPFFRYYFTLGRGKPKVTVDHIWYTFRGRILGRFEVAEIVCNDGTLPRLASLSGEESEWQIRKDAWVAVCNPPCLRIKERIFHEGFRGWRYFNLDEYAQTSEARHRF
jgi:hypothetical protein